jgi:hypothetical protein
VSFRRRLSIRVFILLVLVSLLGIPPQLAPVSKIFNFVMLLMALVAIAVVASIVIDCARYVRSRNRERKGHCGNCGYDLRASHGPCPECGWVRT